MKNEFTYPVPSRAQFSVYFCIYSSAAVESDPLRACLLVDVPGVSHSAPPTEAGLFRLSAQVFQGAEWMHRLRPPFLKPEMRSESYMLSWNGAHFVFYLTICVFVLVFSPQNIESNGWSTKIHCIHSVTLCSPA